VAYEFADDESVRAAIVRCAREQLDLAVAELSERINADPVGAVHDARKAIKKERSLLRLARGAMSPEQRRAENAALREAARGLAGVRDAAVMTATLDQLSHRFVGQVPATTFEKIREQLGHNDGQRGEMAGSGLNDRAIQQLGAVRRRVEDWTLAKDGWSAIKGGLLRGYKRGRKGLAARTQWRLGPRSSRVAQARKRFLVPRALTRAERGARRPGPR
jgi:CHAD domain-containing protein